jgi:hypothetical protein
LEDLVHRPLKVRHAAPIRQSSRVLGDRLKDGSIYKLLAEHGHELFPDDCFANCYSNAVDGTRADLGNGDDPPGLRGLSDREASIASASRVRV